MIIENSTIHIHSGHYSQIRNSETESLRITGATPSPNVADANRATTKPVATKTETSDSGSGRPTTPTNTVDSLKANIVKMMVKAITGRDFELFSAERINSAPSNGMIENEQLFSTPERPSGFGLIYERISSYLEEEQTEFSATGKIYTRDGRTISFSVELTMSRQFSSESHFTFRAGDTEKIDPLVINFDGYAAELSDQYFEFDLDTDGNLEKISTLKTGSGLLALDKNGDGIINNGTELFGPTSGNGFSELARYDLDNNGFIDAADSVFGRLKIWLHAEDGSDQLLGIAEKNIGALYLGHSSTPFDLKSASNRSLGDIAYTGIYLTDQGESGTMQQINFTV